MRDPVTKQPMASFPIWTVRIQRDDGEFENVDVREDRLALQPIDIEPLLRQDFEVIDRDGFDIRLELANFAVRNFIEMQDWLPDNSAN